MKNPTSPEEIEKCLKDPLYYYNNYLRLPGHKILSRKEFKKKVAAYKQERDAALSKEKLEEFRDKEAEIFFKDRPDIIETTHKVIKEDAKARGVELPSDKMLGVWTT